MSALYLLGSKKCLRYVNRYVLISYAILLFKKGVAVMKNAFKTCIVKLLLFFYLFSSYLGATHIHKDALASHV